MKSLRDIPNIGRATEKTLLAMGYADAEDLRKKSAEELYEQECRMKGVPVDRCQLYLYRAVLYYLNTENPDKEKCRWWYWKDENLASAPCGIICLAECPYFPSSCKGCRSMKGRVFWTRYVNSDVCPIYDCCVDEKGYGDCGSCRFIPCRHWELKDPTMSEEEIEKSLELRLKRLKKDCSGA